MLHRTHAVILSVVALACAATMATPPTDQQHAPALQKIHPSLAARFAAAPAPIKAWVFLADKGYVTPRDRAAAIEDVARTYDPHAIQRRALRSAAALRGEPLFTERDLPVAPAYVAAIEATGAQVHIQSRWLNAVSAYVTREQADAVAALSFVVRLEPVAQARPLTPVPDDVTPEPDVQTTPTDGASPRTLDYGNAQAQLQQMNLIALHDAGYTGAGVIVGILDSGFRRTHLAFNNAAHPLQVIAEYDFVKNDPNTAPEPGDPSTQHEHGTMILGTLGAYQPGGLIGGAYDAHFVLAKTEDTSQEVPAEEDNYVAGLEFTEFHGADITTASLGYIDWYTQAQLNGTTAVTTIAVNIHTSLGVHHCNAAGNEGNDTNPATSHLVAPADAFEDIACGAVSSTGTLASFSSDGPTADGRVKPELLARGSSTWTVSPSSTNSYTTASGTSLSTPLVAGAVACLVQARPNWTVARMRENLFETADYFVAHGTFDPQYRLGYGIVNAFAAYSRCPDAGEVTFNQAVYHCGGTLGLTLSDCGLDADPNAIDTAQVTLTAGGDTEVVTLTETAVDSAEFTAALPLATSDAPGVLLVSHGVPIVATYLDADDGTGQGAVVTRTAAVDCLPPVLGNIHVESISSDGAVVKFDADEPVTVTVSYGVDCGAPTNTASSTTPAASPVIPLNGLSGSTTYAYVIEATDAAGNVTVADHNGACFYFRTLNGPQVIYTFPLDANPGFATQGQWAFGTPLGLGGADHGDPDPTSGFTGSNVYGVNLSGDYSVAVGGPYYLTLGPVDLSTASGVSLRFKRWLNSDYQPYVKVAVDASGNGTSWTNLWQNATATIAETAWSTQTYDMAVIADGQPATYVRWGYQVAQTSAWAYSGWNLDDIEIWGVLPETVCLGDIDCDGIVGFADINPFVEALNYPGGQNWPHDCPWLAADANNDGSVTFKDIDPFVTLLGSTCP